MTGVVYYDGSCIVEDGGTLSPSPGFFAHQSVDRITGRSYCVRLHSHDWHVRRQKF